MCDTGATLVFIRLIRDNLVQLLVTNTVGLLISNLNDSLGEEKYEVLYEAHFPAMRYAVKTKVAFQSQFPEKEVLVGWYIVDSAVLNFIEKLKD